MIGSSAYQPRLVDGLLDELVAEIPGVMVVGPRAVGKTTTMSRRAATVVRLDSAREAASFVADPDAALRGLAEPVLLDEWQEVPGVLGAARRAIDADPRPGRFFLTGSVRADAENELWAGTGRIVRMEMSPMTIRERLGILGGDGRGSFFDRLARGSDVEPASDSPDLREYVALALAGGFPQPAMHRSERVRRAWFASYLDDLFTHDVEQLERPRTRRRDAARLRAYFEAYALSSAGVAEHRTIYEAAGVTRVTAMAYEQLLAELRVVAPVPAWASSRLKRLLRQPKRYVIDPALMAAALQVGADGVLAGGDLLGRIIETFVVAQLRPEAVVSTLQPRLHHLRTEQGRHEVGLVVELGGRRVIGIEIKANAAPDARDARHLVWLRDALGDRFVRGVVLHTGPRVYELAERIVAAPISVIWGPGEPSRERRR